jgi:hypothetical protein
MCGLEHQLYAVIAGNPRTLFLLSMKLEEAFCPKKKV